MPALLADHTARHQNRFKKKLTADFLRAAKKSITPENIQIIVDHHL